MAWINFNSFPIANLTGCNLILTPLFGTVGCGNHLDAGGASVWNCLSDGLISTTWGTAYDWVAPDTFNPPAFGAITTCTPQAILLVAWLHFTDNREPIELEARHTDRYLNFSNQPPEIKEAPQ